MSSIDGVPFLGNGCDDSANREREQWQAVGRYLQDPWKASTEEWEGLRDGVALQDGSRRGRRFLKEVLLREQKAT